MEISQGMFKPLQSFTEVPSKPWIANVSERKSDDSLCLCLPVTKSMLDASYAAKRMHKEKYEKCLKCGFTIIAYLYRDARASCWRVTVVDQTQESGVVLKDDNKTNFDVYEKAYQMLEDLQTALIKEPKYAKMYEQLARAEADKKSQRMVNTFNYAQRNEIWTDNEGFKPNKIEKVKTKKSFDNILDSMINIALDTWIEEKENNQNDPSNGHHI